MIYVHSAKAQRNIFGQKAIEISGGAVDGFSVMSSELCSFYANIGYTRTNRNHTHWLLALGYQQKDYGYRSQTLPRVQFTGEVGYFIPVLRNRGQHIAFIIGVSAHAGYESSNWGIKLLDDGATLMNRDGFIWGGALTAQLETYLSDKVVLLLQAKERGLFGTKFGNFHTQVGIGLRFVIK
jgi:hypothetical protein